MRTHIASVLTIALVATTTLAGAAPALATSDPVAPLLVEVQPNPPGTDRGNEWFELANPTPVDLTLDGWAVTDGDGCFAPNEGFVSEYTYSLDGVVVPAGGRTVVTITDVGSCLTLANGGDELELISPTGQVVQSVAWGDDADLPAPPEGSSVAACLLSAGLHGEWGVHGGTPGTANPSCI